MATYTTKALSSGVTLIIRDAEPADAAAALDYVDGVSTESDFLTMAPGEFELTEAQERAILERYLNTENHVFMLAEVDGKIVGMCNFAGGRRQRLQHTGSFGMSVRKAYWGQGIGRVMLDVLIDWAKRSPIVEKVNLQVRADNQRAISLYEQAGFEVEGTERDGLRVNGVSYDLRLMGISV